MNSQHLATGIMIFCLGFTILIGGFSMRSRAADWKDMQKGGNIIAIGAMIITVAVFITIFGVLVT